VLCVVVSYVVNSQSCAWIWLWACYQPNTREASSGKWRRFKCSCRMFLLKFSPEIWQPLHCQGQSCSRQSSVRAVWRLNFLTLCARLSTKCDRPCPEERSFSCDDTSSTVWLPNWEPSPCNRTDELLTKGRRGPSTSFPVRHSLSMLYSSAVMS